MSIQANNIQTKNDRLGLSASIFCKLAGLSETKWTRVLRGVVVLPGPEILRLIALSDELQAAAESAKPFTLDLKNVDALRSLLAARKMGIRWVSTIAVIELVEQ